MSKRIIVTTNAPLTKGFGYSQGVKTGGLVYVSGQLPIDPLTNEMIVDDINKATRQTLENIKSILEEAGTNISEVVKTTIYLRNMDDLKEVSKVYVDYFVADCPARSCIEVSRLPFDAPIEIEVIAETWN